MVGSEVFERNMKAEGLAVLSADKTKISVVIMFDNDFSRTGQAAAYGMMDILMPFK